MRALWIAAAVLAAAISVEGCKKRREEPVPGPQSQPASPAPKPSGASGSRSHAGMQKEEYGVSGIAWLQQNAQESFSRSHPDRLSILGQ